MFSQYVATPFECELLLEHWYREYCSIISFSEATGECNTGAEKTRMHTEMLVEHVEPKRFLEIIRSVRKEFIDKGSDDWLPDSLPDDLPDCPVSQYGYN